MHWRSCLTARYMSGGGWRRGAERRGSYPGSPTASGPSWACSGARCLSHFAAQWGPQTWHCYEPWGRPLPCFPLSLPLAPSFPLFVSRFFSARLSLFLPPLPGASPPSRVGQRTGHRALLCRHSHLTRCGTTWLITNPIWGPCVSAG